MKKNIFEGYIYKNKKRNSLKGFLFLFIFIFICIIITITFGFSLNSKLVLSKENIVIPNLSKDIEGINILHISDLNGNVRLYNNNEYQNLLKEKQINIICLTGNMIGNNDQSIFINFVKKLRTIIPSVPIIYLPGEYDSINTNIEIELNNIQNFIILDKPYKITKKNTKIWISPEYVYTINAQNELNSLTNEMAKINTENSDIYKKLFYQSRLMENIIDAEKECAINDVQIILSSTPISNKYLSQNIQEKRENVFFKYKNVSLILSGSLVGGQWRLPGGQPIYVPEYGWFPNKEDIYGKSRLLTMYQYISPGISTSPIYNFFRGRIYNPPTITILKFTSTYK